MTISLTARCPDTGAFGIAISSSSPAVAARCIHLRPGVGASASQNITDPRLGAVEVTVRKLRPPLALDVAATGVRILRSREVRLARPDPPR